MNHEPTEHATDGAAVAAPVERPVRPCAWMARRIDWPAGKWEPFKGDSPPHWADLADALYSQAALDAEIAAERARRMPAWLRETLLLIGTSGLHRMGGYKARYHVVAEYLAGLKA